MCGPQQQLPWQLPTTGWMPWLCVASWRPWIQRLRTRCWRLFLAASPAFVQPYRYGGAVRVSRRCTQLLVDCLAMTTRSSCWKMALHPLGGQELPQCSVWFSCPTGEHAAVSRRSFALLTALGAGHGQHEL